jgi:GNAT superfamily N-acetyltransferase
MARQRDEILDAIETFVHGYCVGRSATHAHHAERVGDLWVMRDAPRRNARGYRKEEWVAYDVAPKLADAAARRQTRGRFFVSTVVAAGESDDGVRAEFKRLGYRLTSGEGFFVQRLKKIPRAAAPTPVTIRRVRTAAMAEQLGQATQSRPIPRECYAMDGPFRQYVAIDGETIVGWVRSVPVGRSTWCSHMGVRPSHRRRGIGRALVAKMLRDDRAAGVKQSVLLASKAGALLYPHVGYVRIGTLLIFAPLKK